MNSVIKSGLSFGFTSGVITTLGLMVGLHSGTHSTLAVAGGIVTIAVADAMSDALGMHVAKESENIYSEKQIWLITLITFTAKFLIAMTFCVPLLLFNLETAIWVSVGWGLSILTVLSYILARSQKTPPLGVIGEHLFVAVLVIITTHFLGDWISEVFGGL